MRQTLTSGLKEPLFGLDAESLSKLLVAAGEPAFRGKQLAEAMYRQWLTAIFEISTLPVALRGRLAAEGWQIGRPAIARAFQSVDGTERYLIEFAGSGGKGQTVEAVWMPERRRRRSWSEQDSVHPFRSIAKGGEGNLRQFRTKTGPAPPSASPRRSVAPSTASSA